MQANVHLAPTVASKETLSQFQKWSTGPITQDHATDMEAAFLKLMKPEFADNVPFWTQSLEDAFVLGIESCVTNYGYLVRKPHIIISVENHPAAVAVVRRLVAQKRCEASFLRPKDGQLSVSPEQYKKEIKRNTCAICVPMMNFWTGAFIDVKGIAHARIDGRLSRIPILTDITPLWGRYGRIDLAQTEADVWFLDFQHISGITGLGCCLVKEDLRKAYQITPMASQIRPNAAVMAATYVAWKQNKTASLDGIKILHRMLSEYGCNIYTPLTDPPSFVILVEIPDVDTPTQKLLKNKIIADVLPPGCPYTTEGTFLQLSFSSLNVDQARKVFAALTD